MQLRRRNNKAVNTAAKLLQVVIIFFATKLIVGNLSTWICFLVLTDGVNIYNQEPTKNILGKFVICIL